VLSILFNSAKANIIYAISSMKWEHCIALSEELYRLAFLGKMEGKQNEK